MQETAAKGITISASTTLLLVDDDARQLEMRALTMKMSGFVVLTARNAFEAITIISQEGCAPIDVAILDYEMPKMNGCDLANHLRHRCPKMKIILHSGAGDIPESEMGSVDVFVPKGDNIARLVEEASNQRESQGFSDASAGDFRL
jgi:DNA-binding NtrC family response regulator